MEHLPPSSARPELELEFRLMESVPLAQIHEGAEALLTMDISDDLLPLGFESGEKPAVPLGADELVSYYEKQLAAAQLVQHRLQKQFNQLVDEKLALETSLSVQTAALQQQLILAREKAERAFAQAEHAQQQVQESHAAVGEIVGAVTQLAELLDVSGATKELSNTFEAVARSTQRTFQAVVAAQEGSQAVLELQLEARDACQASPLLTAASVGSPRGSDATRRMEETVRLKRELDDAKRREQELEAEMRAAQLLFSGLEAEVVSLQHDQVQAAAKLQLSQEELVAAREELLVAQESLAASHSPTADALAQGLAKLDAHLVSVRSFLEGLSMPQPPGNVDVLGGSTLQLHAGRSGGGNVTARNAAMSDDVRTSTESNTFLRLQGLSPQQQMRELIATESGEVQAQSPQEVSGMAPSGHQFIEQAGTLARPQVPKVPDERQRAGHDHCQVLSQQMAAVAAERDSLRSRAVQLESRIASLEIEKEGLLRERVRQLGMAAAAGAAGAAAAVVVATDTAASTRSTSPSRPPLVLGAVAPASIMGLDVSLEAVTAGDTGHQQAEPLEEVEALRELLRHSAGELDGTQKLSERLASSRGMVDRQLSGKKSTRSAKPQAAMHPSLVNAADLAAGLGPDVLGTSPPSPLSRPRPVCTRVRRSDSSITSGNRTMGEADYLFSEHCEPFQEVSRVYTRSSTAVQSSYQSFTSEVPLAPTQCYTEDSQPHTYPLDPMEPLEELLPAAAVGGSTAVMCNSSGGLSREHSRDSRRAHRTFRSYPDVPTLPEEVEELQAAICSLLISKAVACTELKAESERSLAALRAAHNAELMKLHEDHFAEVAKLQALLAESADMLSSPPPSQHAATQYVDKSTRVSDDCLLGGQYEAELLQYTAALGVRTSEMEECNQQLATVFERRLERMQADHESQLSDMASRLQQAGASQAARAAADSERIALQQLIEDLRQQCAREESRTLALGKEHSADLRDQQAQHAEGCLQLQAGTALVTIRHEDETTAWAAHGEELAELRLVMRRLEDLRMAERKAAETELVAFQDQITKLREQLATKVAEEEAVRVSFKLLQEEASVHRAAAEKLQRRLKDYEGEGALRESLIVELRSQLRQLQTDKEVEEQSLQSLLSTKTWMTEEIRSLQSELKETSAKLALAEVDLATMKAAAASGVSSGTSRHVPDDGAVLSQLSSSDGHGLAASARQRETRASEDVRGFGSSSPAATSLACGAIEAQGGSVITMAADQLAEAVMQAVLAEARLETLQLQQNAGAPCTPAGMQSLCEPDVERTNLMMETVALQGELDQLRGQHCTLQTQLDAVADELAYAVMRASLAELQLEQLRLQRAGAARSESTALLRPDRQSRANNTSHASQPADLQASDASLHQGTSNYLEADENPSGITTSEQLCTGAFTPVQQASKLYRDLQIVRRALGDIIVTDPATPCSASRDALSSAWEAAIAAQDRAANLARDLQQQQQQRLPAELGAESMVLPASRDELSAENAHDRALAASSLQTELSWARRAYRDTCEVYEMLRTDAEDINNQLWSCNVMLRKQLFAMEEELIRAKAEAMPGPQLAFEATESRREIRSMEGQVSELQAGLQAAHSRLLHRDGQIATLQHMFVQLSEQISVFEDVVVRCEVLSAGLASKPAV